MRKLIYIFSLLIFFYSCNNFTVSSISLNKEGNIYKHKGELFNGKVLDMNKKGRVFLSFECKQGKIEGEYLKYHKNGKIELKFNYHNGLKEGESLSFYSNGDKKDVANYKNDKLDGNWESYHHHNQLKEKGIYRLGIK